MKDSLKEFIEELEFIRDHVVESLEEKVALEKTLYLAYEFKKKKEKEIKEYFKNLYQDIK